MILGGSAAPLRAPPCALCACARQLPGALTTKSGEAGTREIILELFVLIKCSDERVDDETVCAACVGTVLESFIHREAKSYPSCTLDSR